MPLATFEAKAWMLGLALLTAGCVRRPPETPSSVPITTCGMGPAPVQPRVHAGDSIYFVMVDRYANGDRSNDGDVDAGDPAAFHGGDLQGVLDHLDDIQREGFTTVWLSPVWKMRTAKFFDHGAFHGYWVEDFTRIEPRFGTAELLRSLSDELHRRGMKLILDVVLNHVAFDSPLVKEHPDWFHHLGNIKDWNNREELETHDVMGLPDLAQENPAVYDYLLATSEHWIDTLHPDGFRLDAVKHIPLAFWVRYNRAIHEHAGPGFLLLGEDLDGDPTRVANTWIQGGFDAMFDFPLSFAVTDVFCKGAPLARLAAVLSQDEVYPNASELVTLADNHDLPRLLTACGGDVAHAESALQLLFAVRGIPSVTYGTEIGLTGEKEPENRGDMRFGTPPVLPVAIPLKRAAAGAPIEVVDLTADRLELATEGESKSVVITRQGVSKAQRSVRAPAPRPRDIEVHLRGLSGVSAGDVVLVGTSAALGDWNPKRGLGPLRWQGDRFAVTSALTSGKVYAYKFVVRHADGSVEWEKRDNRYLYVPLDGEVASVDATWGE